MKRLISLAVTVAATVASFVLAQPANQATLRTPNGDRTVSYIQQEGQTYFSAAEVIAALGGAIVPDSTGFKLTLGTTVAAFGPDSRFAVVAEDLIEMPVVPLVIEGRPFVTWHFFSGFLSRATALDASWDAAANVLSIHTRQSNAVNAQVSVTDLRGISKIVVTLATPTDYTIIAEPGVYTIRFRNPIRAPFADQSYDDPLVARITFSGTDLRVQLRGPDIAGDDYRLENPFRVVLDLRKGAGPAITQVPGTPGGRSPEPPGIRTIVIDPGHGGKEVGAVGPNGLLEKDVTLEVSRKLASALERLGTRVVLTRDDDSIVSLDQRTAIANQYKADLFLSVHMNAAVVKGAKGSETYFLSLEASDDLARRAAETENAAAATAAATPASAAADLKLILWDLAHQEYVQESSRLAQAIQEEMNKATGVQNRGVKQAPFKVLVGATMPAALVEVGFITNPEEEARLQSDAFQDVMVEALVRAVQRYKTEYETRIGLANPNAPPPLAGGIAPRRTGT